MEWAKPSTNFNVILVEKCLPDLLFFNDAGKIVRKETYAKTEKPALRRLDR